METIKYPAKDSWDSLCRRALADKAAEVTATVTDIIAEVEKRGDQALIDYEKRFTGASLSALEVTAEELDHAETAISDELKTAINQAAENIEAFHKAQMMAPVEVETSPGVRCLQRAVPIERVGLYIPGGNSPLFSTVLMLAIPARIAGCREIILCTPPGKDGSVHPAILYAARLAGVKHIFKTGGAQAIAAMSVGTGSVPKVDKIFGPGNRFVMEAKQQVSRSNVAIDMPAGPSEVLVIADDTADAEFVAADFLSQAEHGPDSQSLLLTDSARLADILPEVIDRLMSTLPRQDMMNRSLTHSRVILLHDTDEIMAFSNMYSPEHLIINHRQADALAEKVINAGSVFIGPWSPESAGDYASGTNHTLPTSGYARAYSGVNIDSFMKKITFQRLTPQGIASIGRTVEIMAENEDLMAHKLAMTLRLNAIKK
ncbi:MAG TPA: histidinol dehydrogenase [Muribaculum sp.]|jgi:histidinol dehydrogenase|uniref:Histidinol dehydrogenase n=1 Tax=Heminiphilus faecis TaxID=2601703 RepID=A0ABV4CXB8_9BACT|nr:histidinol dehydrogenase [Heminiphilus faecis]RLT77450.1 histidinol dehydrogenase [bacterium J10(2018)]HRF69648.1 histidinol dehydrogenase [Muribaculum sp.]